MDHGSGIAFEEFQKDERFKRLERNLKLAFAKQVERMKAGDQRSYCTSPTWPNMSSINPDGQDTSSVNGAASLQDTRSETEVISSSTNLRKAFPNQKGSYVERAPIATSSVKKHPVNKIDKDRAIMPPPLNINSKITNNVVAKHKVHDRNRKDTNPEPHNASTKMSSCDSSACEESDRGLSHTSKGNRTFSCWRVFLNEQGQLIIKGIWECGKVARSKPIIQRLSSNKVKSLYKHIYILNGNIVDEKNELPDYVCGKFHNGFPDDWENVYQLWRNYVAEGCPVTFRWPMPIADSDDDLISEIADFTFINNNKFQEEKQFLKSISNDGSSGYHSKIQLDSQQSLEKYIDEQIDKVTPAIHKINEKVNDSGHSSEIKDNSCNNECRIENSKDISSNSTANSTSNLKNASYLYEIIREDKLRIILSNLGDKDCPPEYLDRFIELIDCLRYILSYKSNSNREVEPKPSVSTSKNQIQSCQKCNNIASCSESQDINTEEKIKSVRNEEYTKPEEFHKSKEQQGKPEEYYTQCKPVHMSSNESSDSDCCMGIPHVPLDRLIKSKLSRPQRYKYRRNRSRDSKSEESEKGRNGPKKNIWSTQPSSKKSNITDEIVNEYDDDINVELKFFSPTKVKNKSDNANKEKPLHKNCEPVKSDSKLKHLSKSKNMSHSDISILNGDSFLKKQKPPKSYKYHQKSNNSNKSHDNDVCEAMLPETVRNHPFISFDSDGDITDEEEATLQLESDNTICKTEKKINEAVIKSKVENKECNKKGIEQKSTSKNKSVPENNEEIALKSFGSKENPKILTSWTPYVTYDDDYKRNCSLKYEGKLLNENGYILNRKFMTNAICQRHSLRLVETVNNEYFLLDGEVNDTKHVIPKDLMKLCRAGCPSKIKEFCQEWIRLKNEENNIVKASQNLFDSPVDHVKVPNSSHEYQILPPHKNLTDEQSPPVDNNPVYHSGPKEHQLMPTKLRSPKKSAALSEQRQRNKPEENPKRVKSSVKSDVLPKAQATQKYATKRIAMQLNYSSSHSSNEGSEPRNEKIVIKSERLLNNNSAAKSAPMQVDSQPTVEMIPESSCNVKLRKRQKVNIKEKKTKNSIPHNRRPQVSTKNCSSGITWTLQKTNCYDLLSDDEPSVIVK